MTNLWLLSLIVVVVCFTIVCGTGTGQRLRGIDTPEEHEQMAETVSVAFDSSSFKSTDSNFALAEHRKLAASVFVTLGSNPVCVNITEITASNGTVGFNLPLAYVVNLQLATTNSLSTFTNVFKVTNFLHNTPFDVLVSLERLETF